jgi:transcription antitermination factor NusG
MTPQPTGESWFAVQVKSRWERSTATLLTGKGYQTLLPTYQAQKRWSGRVKNVPAPLFPGYVFCRFDVGKRLPILVTPGVIALVGRGRIPVPVEDSEMAGLETLVSSGMPAEPWPYLEVGQRVRIEDQALQGMEGILLGFKGHRRIVVSITLLRRSVALEIDRARVTAVGTAAETAAGSLALSSLPDGLIV